MHPSYSTRRHLFPCCYVIAFGLHLANSFFIQSSSTVTYASSSKLITLAYTPFFTILHHHRLQHKFLAIIVISILYSILYNLSSIFCIILLYFLHCRIYRSILVFRFPRKMQNLNLNFLYALIFILQMTNFGFKFYSF